MTKIIKPLRIAIDLQSLLAKTLPEESDNLRKKKAFKGSLGAVTLFSEVFDLYLLNKYTRINNDEIMRWLSSAQINHCFRHVVPVDENLRNFYLQNHIGITIASDHKLVTFAKDISSTYWLQEVHTLDIQDGIQKINLWKDLVRDITKYSTSEDYDYRHPKD